MSIKYEAIQRNANPHLFLSKNMSQYLRHGIMTIKIFAKLYVSRRRQKNLDVR